MILGGLEILLLKALTGKVAAAGAAKLGAGAAGKTAAAITGKTAIGTAAHAGGAHGTLAANAKHEALSSVAGSVISPETDDEKKDE